MSNLVSNVGCDHKMTNQGVLELILGIGSGGAQQGAGQHPEAVAGMFKVFGDEIAAKTGPGSSTLVTSHRNVVWTGDASQEFAKQVGRASDFTNALWDAVQGGSTYERIGHTAQREQIVQPGWLLAVRHLAFAQKGAADGYNANATTAGQVFSDIHGAIGWMFENTFNTTDVQTYGINRDFPMVFHSSDGKQPTDFSVTFRVEDWVGAYDSSKHAQPGQRVATGRGAQNSWKVNRLTVTTTAAPSPWTGLPAAVETSTWKGKSKDGAEVGQVHPHIFDNRHGTTLTGLIDDYKYVTTLLPKSVDPPLTPPTASTSTSTTTNDNSGPWQPTGPGNLPNWPTTPTGPTGPTTNPLDPTIPTTPTTPTGPPTTSPDPTQGPYTLPGGPGGGPPGGAGGLPHSPGGLSGMPSSTLPDASSPLGSNLPSSTLPGLDTTPSTDPYGTTSSSFDPTKFGGLEPSKFGGGGLGDGLGPAVGPSGFDPSAAGSAAYGGADPSAAAREAMEAQQAAGGRGMPMMPMSPGGAGAGGNQDRPRKGYLSEDESIWGIEDGDAAPPVLGG